MKRSVLPKLVLASFLALLLLPLVFATWISFSPGETLDPPRGEWSLRWYRAFFASPQWTASVWNSAKVAVQSVLLALVCGFGVAHAVARGRFRGRYALSLAVLVPLYVPSIVLGMALLPFFRALGLWGTSTSIALAHALWSLPVVYLVARAAFEAIDPDLERAAAGLGASRFQTAVHVTLPLLAPAIGLGAFTAFVLSLNEFLMALFLAIPETATLPSTIWPNLRYTLTPIVAAASTLSLLATLVCIAAGVAVARAVARNSGIRRARPR